ncbi:MULTISPECIES: YhgE/Pip domain-containing protein [unclassified Paenibacillus]|uniref:YhgE/Pip domain-containing protein n=1 Tax=unclassified Paenibacillus TaxID=185978 RepID=UPI00041BCEE3|nr:MULTISPECIES: YhgE/Pip domain-containing protein [unclassified Paenibacillus]KGP81857.1 phage infection protein [Paenibacillus sp. MAEPY2]KGP86600.1 phage infection protein [Paenibacillus sp. MAEPY1]
MRHIWHVYKTDWLHILKVPTGIFLIVAIILLPGVYDWVNVKSVWDPYSNTQGIKIAVTTEDKGATVAGTSVNIGDELVSSLKQNEKLGWTFVNQAEAERGVQTGEYYASLLIPEDFSSKITGIVDGKLERPEVIYTVNEKVNAIAPKITGSGVSAITTQINENFTEAVSQAVLTKLKEAGVEINAQLPTLRKMENGIFTLEKNLPAIQSAGQKVLEVEKAMPGIVKDAQKIVEIEKKLPEINEAAQYVLKVQEYWPQINDAASEVLAIQGRIPDIQKAVERIREVDANFGQVSGVIQTALDKTDKALSIVTAAEQDLDKVSQIAGNGIELAEGLNQFVDSSEEAFQAIGPAIRQNLLLVQQIANAAGDVFGQLQNTDLNKLPTPEDLDRIAARLGIAVKLVDSMAELLSKIDNLLPSHPLSNKITQLNTISDKLQLQIRLAGIISDAMRRNTTPPADVIAQLNALSKDISSGIGNILNTYDSEISPALAAGADKLRSILSTSADALQGARDRIPDIKDILASAKEGITFGQTELTKIQSELPQIQSKIHEISETLANKSEGFIQALNTVSSLIRNDLPKLGTKLNEAADFVRNDLPNAEKQIGKASDFVQNQLPEVEKGVHRVATLVRDDLPALESAISKAADKLREVEGNNQFAELAKLLRGDIEEESAFLASPVQIKEQQLYPIPNYGSAMSPFYGVLSLWVGSTLLISLLRAEAENPEGKFRGYELYLGRLATFLTIGLLQAVCVSLGDILILGTYVADKLWFVLFAMLVSAVFVTITYTLLSVFGNIGKGIAIIFMVFQFSSSGGTFPISMTSPFFQALNPFMPFTYAISLLRESVGGILWSTAIKDILWLCMFIALSLIVALALKRPLSSLTKRSAENAKKTKIIA